MCAALKSDGKQCVLLGQTILFTAFFFGHPFIPVLETHIQLMQKGIFRT